MQNRTVLKFSTICENDLRNFSVNLQANPQNKAVIKLTIGDLHKIVRHNRFSIELTIKLGFWILLFAT